MTKEKLNRVKGRNLTFEEFFETLQLEYIVAELRWKIYSSEKDKTYYKEREMDGKKVTIQEISSRNNFKDIFNDLDTQNKYYSQIYNEWGLPNFIYRNQEDRETRRKIDIYNFFKRGIEVSVKLDTGEIVKGKITFTNLEKSTVSVKIEAGYIVTVPYEMVARMINFR